jgi:hypothetical protein
MLRCRIRIRKPQTQMTHTEFFEQERSMVSNCYFGRHLLAYDFMGNIDLKLKEDEGLRAPWTAIFLHLVDHLNSHVLD